MPANDPDARIGSVLDGRYKVLEPLSRGGMGVVYRAERVPVGRPVAVKFLHALFEDDRDSRARFERETRALSKLAHPHCVSIIDFGYDGAPYLVMELVAGRTLREILDDGPLPIEDALTIARQLLAGLAHAHAEGIVHRDVKPANVMVTDEIGTGRHARILDFGLARLVDRTMAHKDITSANIAIGTPSYMSPEQTRGESTDARTDVYAVGVLLFEMVTGQRPFVAEDTGALLDLHRHMPAPRLADVDPSRAWPAGLDAAIQRALAKDPDDRWQTAVEFATALETRRATSMPPDEEAPAPRSGGSARKVAAILALLLASAGAAFAYMELRKQPAVSSGTATRDGDAASALGTAAGATAAGATAAGEPTGDATAATTVPLADAGVLAPDLVTADATALGTLPLADAAIDSATADAPDVVPPDAPDAPDAAPAAEPAVDEPEADLGVDPPEPLPAADPEIESVDPAPEPPSADDTPTEGLPPPTTPSSIAPTETPAPPTAAAPAATPAPVAPPQVKTVAQALALARRGRRDEAIAGVRALWRKQPRNANLPYVLGNLYHDKRWWSVAMEHYQAAIARAPAYRRNATLTRNVISMLASPRTRAKASWFLRKIVGAPAKAHLRVAAKRHKSAAVRKNAAAVLRRF